MNLRRLQEWPVIFFCIRRSTIDSSLCHLSLVSVARSTVDVVKYLVGRCDNRRALNDGFICHAASYGKVDTLAFLMSLGYEKNDTLDLALKDACRGVSLEVMNLLMEAGANPRAHSVEFMKWACLNGTVG